MKRLFFVILFAIATVNSYAQYKGKGYFMADTVKLNATYHELLKHPESKEAQMAYFEASQIHGWNISQPISLIRIIKMKERTYIL